MNVDFVLGLTGTPIENRLEDLWCITDRICPGYLGPLKEFSKIYGSEQPDQLSQLKDKMEKPQGNVPAVMLRRMKETILDGLPEKRVETYQIDMPGVQAGAYSKSVTTAQTGQKSQGAMLKALHAFRGISLHPNGADNIDPYDASAVQEWLQQSARLKKAIEVLREIEKKREKAIVFLEDRAVQKVFAAAVTTLFGVRSEPRIINGQTPGDKRQSIVDEFQSLPPGFDILVLSPRAAGVGLTITAANHVIHLSRWWNPAVEDQCNDRVYRIGQERPVTVHVPMAVHPTYGDASFDVMLDKLIQRKRELSRNMLAPPVNISDVSELFGDTVG